MRCKNVGCGILPLGRWDGYGDVRVCAPYVRTAGTVQRVRAAPRTECRVGRHWWQFTSRARLRTSAISRRVKPFCSRNCSLASVLSDMRVVQNWTKSHEVLAQTRAGIARLLLRVLGGGVWNCSSMAARLSARARSLPRTRREKVATRVRLLRGESFSFYGRGAIIPNRTRHAGRERVKNANKPQVKTKQNSAHINILTLTETLVHKSTGYRCTD